MKNKMLKGTIILTVAGVITRVIGFFYIVYFWQIFLEIPNWEYIR